MEHVGEVLEAARDAYRRHDWAAARERFTAARAAAELAAADLEALADAAWWLGDVEEATAVLEDAHRRHLDEGRPGPAAMAAIGIAVNHLLRGDGVVGSGWLTRAQRLLRDAPEGVEHGYALYLEVEGALAGGDPDTVVTTARRLRDIGRRHGDPNLVAGGDLFEGRALVKQGRMAEGMALLDEAMLTVLSGELRPEPQDRGPASVQHLRQAGRDHADPGGRLRLRARPGRPGPWVGRPSAPAWGWAPCPMPGRAGPPTVRPTSRSSGEGTT